MSKDFSIGKFFFVLILICGIAYFASNWSDIVSQRRSDTVLNEQYAITDVKTQKRKATNTGVWLEITDIKDYTLEITVHNMNPTVYKHVFEYKMWEITENKIGSVSSKRIKEYGRAWRDKIQYSEKIAANTDYVYEIDLHQFDPNMIDGKFVMQAGKELVYFDFTYTGGKAKGAIAELD